MGRPSRNPGRKCQAKHGVARGIVQRPEAGTADNFDRARQSVWRDVDQQRDGALLAPMGGRGRVDRLDVAVGRIGARRDDVVRVDHRGIRGTVSAAQIQHRRLRRLGLRWRGRGRCRRRGRWRWWRLWLRWWRERRRRGGRRRRLHRLGILRWWWGDLRDRWRRRNRGSGWRRWLRRRRRCRWLRRRRRCGRLRWSGRLWRSRWCRRLRLGRRWRGGLAAAFVFHHHQFDRGRRRRFLQADMQRRQRQRQHDRVQRQGQAQDQADPDPWPPQRGAAAKLRQLLGGGQPVGHQAIKARGRRAPSLSPPVRHGW